MKPTRRTTLRSQAVGEELVVYDGERQTVHRLDRTAALVYRHLDGTTSIPELGAIVEGELGVEEGEALVALTLVALNREGLLAGRGLSGVQKGLLVGAGLALLVPVVETLRPPAAAATIVF